MKKIRKKMKKTYLLMPQLENIFFQGSRQKNQMENNETVLLL